MASSRIEWTESTWNPVTGCTKISPGCDHCYAERMAMRLQAMGQPNYVDGFKPSLHPHVLDYPLHWKKSQVIFVNSMSDTFHSSVPDVFIQKIFSVMEEAHWHSFQVLTKRSRRAMTMAKELTWSPNIWMGVTIENQDYKSRIDHLLEIPAAVRFLSLEPLLGPVPKMNLKGIDWVIVGGESGPGSRPMEKEWVCDIRDQCCEAGVKFFFKQWGGVNKKKAGRLLDGILYDDMPEQQQATG
ncbi:Gp37Gp68 family protein [Desulfatibacillum aliphaticivorans]|uniref:Gp37Gp68 family protein n=1 Tax=Desulfatibacillum aliphaticivorans TaxID=218208 RepID=B8FMA5_DESAL|nr:phage Gp37/Gp68 family protein [Desulfatibacillum aliphaticivorans]ACL05943.1 Gp37Gp68 family protein [Desulfatibacillum aliphaticivorans]